MLLLFAVPLYYKAAPQRFKHHNLRRTRRRPVWSLHFKNLQSHQRRHWDVTVMVNLPGHVPPPEIRPYWAQGLWKALVFLNKGREIYTLISGGEGTLVGVGWLTSHEKSGVDPWKKDPFPFDGSSRSGSGRNLQTYMDDWICVVKCIGKYTIHWSYGNWCRTMGMAYIYIYVYTYMLPIWMVEFLLYISR